MINTSSNKLPLCKVCKSNKISKLYSLEARKYSPGTYFNLVLCEDCELVFIDLLYEDDFRSKYYPKDYKPHTINKNSSYFFINALMTRLRKFTFGSVYSLGYYSQIYFKKIVSFLYNKNAYRSIPFYRGSGKILDIGCGIGGYLNILKNIGWEVRGVEPGKKAVQVARQSGLDVDCGSFEEIEYPEKDFDVVTMWHVLEHFPDPKKALQSVSNILKDDGLLLIGIPNYDSLDRNIFQKYWNGFEIPLHLCHFTPSSIEKLLNISGFNCRKIVHTIRPTDMVSSLEAFFTSRWKRKSFYLRILLLLFSIPVSFLFSVLKRSSIIVIHAKKCEKDLSIH